MVPHSKMPQVVRGLTSNSGNGHISDVSVDGGANNSVTFSSLLPLVEYSFNVSIRAGPFQSVNVAEGRQSPSVNVITPSTCKSLN